MAPKKGPSRLSVQAYQMGFGDCFLLTWHYATGKKHILIDFGSKAAPKTAPPKLAQTVAADIAKECGGKLDAVVVTHRHQDHISGFTTSKNGKGPGDVIRALKPTIVVQPWTEDPDAKPDATESTVVLKGASGFVGMLSHMQDASEALALEAGRIAAREPRRGLRPTFLRLKSEAAEGIKNASAVKNLETMSNRHAYVHHGSASGLDAILPGVRVTVLGPPTLKQSAAIRSERAVDQAQFWMLQASAGTLTVKGVKNLFPNSHRLSSRNPPPYARWFLPRVRRMRAEGMQQIVRVLDDAMNNTSVILLFEVGGKSFLFPGDAQIENWEFTLAKPALMKRLADVTFYKVGHHGSRNATPKSLWAAFTNRGPVTKKSRLTTVVSTMAGPYGKTEATEVPRKTLIDALKQDSHFFTTQSLKKGQFKLTEGLEFTL
jgi:L-ascorbate metabolism protein UlaG (beta-lactamase superfamily)